MAANPEIASQSSRRLQGRGHTSVERLEELGIVGAGGGGFPAAVKFRTKVSLVIANAAECEPLLHKDKELLQHGVEPFLRGLRMAMELVGAREGVVGIKEKYHDIIAALEARAPCGVRVVSLPDCYPAGDEFILVHMVTGRVIPPGGLPKDVDTVVSNVETLINMALDRPVTHKYLTVAGAVETPVTLRVPVGITIGEVIDAAGGATVDDIGVLLGGVMMAKPAASLDVPGDQDDRRHCRAAGTHSLIRRHNAPWIQVEAHRPLGLRPVPLLHGVLPALSARASHRAASRHAVAGVCNPGLTRAVATLYCCECNLCTMYACPEDLDPKTVCVQNKPMARERGLTFKGDPKSITPHPMAEFRRVPMRRLIARLGLGEFNNEGPLKEHKFAPRKVNSAARSSMPACRRFRWSRCGDRVREGDLLAVPQQGKLGARIHASIDGVATVTDDAVVIEA